MPGSVPKELEEQTLTFVREDPPYGPERTPVGYTGYLERSSPKMKEPEIRRKQQIIT
jgi:hypothetical protein